MESGGGTTRVGRSVLTSIKPTFRNLPPPSLLFTQHKADLSIIDGWLSAV